MVDGGMMVRSLAVMNVLVRVVAIRWLVHASTDMLLCHFLVCVRVSTITL